MTVIDFATAAAAARAAAGRDEWKSLLLYRADGISLLPGIHNIATILRHDPTWRDALSHDEFRGEDLLRARGVTDVDVTSIREWFSGPTWTTTVSAETANAVVSLVAHERLCHPVRDYLSSLVWDGTPRLATWLTRYLGVEDTPYTRTVGSSWLISAVARVYQPGCKADHVLVLEGEQGTGKSTALSILAGAWFADTPIDLGSKDAYQALRGKWIVELGELASLRKADVERAKAFFSASTDTYRPSYGRRSVDVPRQCVFAGSTNLDAYLQDATGNRRFWPIRTGAIDLDALRRDRDQIWAEALDAYNAGVPWWIDDPKIARLASDEQSARQTGDAWEADITAWLSSSTASAIVKREGGITTRDVLVEGLKMTPAEIHNGHEQRVAIVMRQLKWSQGRPWRPDGTRPRVWLRP